MAMETISCLGNLARATATTALLRTPSILLQISSPRSRLTQASGITRYSAYTIALQIAYSLVARSSSLRGQLLAHARAELELGQLLPVHTTNRRMEVP